MKKSQDAVCFLRDGIDVVGPFKVIGELDSRLRVGRNFLQDGVVHGVKEDAGGPCRVHNVALCGVELHAPLLCP